jgi:hypothetical protein
MLTDPNQDESTASLALRSPSLWRHAPALVLALVALTDVFRYVPADLWGQIRMGQDMLRARHVIGRDIYSYAIAGRVWRNQEWLSCVVMALAYDRLGVVGLKLLKLSCTAGTIGLLAAAVSETGASVRLQAAILVTAAAIVSPFMEFRPQIFTYLLLAGLLALLARDTYRGAGKLAWSVPGMALWANLHGGFVVGAATLTTYGAARLLTQPALRRDWRRCGRLLLVIALALLATLATPYGLDTWLTVLHSLRSTSAHMAITEWQPTLSVMVYRFHQTWGATLLCFIPTMLLLGCLLITVTLAPRGGDGPLLAVAALLVLGAFVSMRNIPLGVIGIVVPLARHGGLWLRGRHEPAEPRSQRYFVADQSILALLAIAVLFASGLFSRRLPAPLPYPQGAVAYMRDHSLSGRILDDVNWGGYLLWHRPGESRVFIDNRFETAFPEPLIRQYLDFLYGLGHWQALLDRYPHDFVLVGVQRPAYRLMLTRPDWKLVYRDCVAGLFARRGSPAARAPGVPTIDRAHAQAVVFP